MGQDVTFDIIARDRASSTFSKVGKGAKSSEGSIAKLGSSAKKALGAVLAFETAKTVTKGLIGMAQAAAEDQTSMALLAKQFKNSAHATDAQIASTEAWITKVGQARGVADDELRPALGSLVTATHNVTKAQQLTNLAMNIAAAKGKPLAAVSLALSKAYNGNVGALGRLGIKTKDNAGKTLSFADAQKQLNQQFGGAANAKAKTFTGVMDRFHVAVQEGGEAIGYKMLPALTKFVPKMSRFITGMQDGTGAGGKFVAEVKSEVLPVVQNLATEGKLLFGAIKPIVGALASLPAPMVAFGGASAVLGTRLGSLRPQLEEGASGFSKLGRAASSAAGGAGLLAVADAASQTSPALGGLEGALGGAVAGFAATGNPIGALIGGVGGGLLGIFSSGKKAKTGVDQFGQSARQNLASIDSLAATVNNVTGAFTRLTKQDLGRQLQDAGAFLDAKKIGIQLDTVTKATLGNAAAQKTISKAVDRTQTSFNDYYNSLKNSQGIVEDVTPAQAKRIQQLAAERDAAKELAKVTRQLGDNAVAGSKKQLELSLATGKLGKVLEGIPSTKVLKIHAEGDKQARNDIIALGASGKKITDKQYAMLVKVADLTGTLGDIAKIKAAADKAAKARIVKFTALKVGFGAVGGNGIPGDGIGSDGRRGGQTLMQQLAAQITKGTPKVKVALDRAKGLFQSFTDKVNSLKDTKSGFLSTFSSDSIFGADSDTTGGTLSGLLQFQQKQASDASQLLNDIKSLTSRGLSKGLISQLQAAGSSGAAQLHLLAGGSASDISQFNSLNARTQSSDQQAGLLAGNYVRGGNIDSDIKAAADRAAMTKAIVEALSHMKLTTKVSGGDLIIAVRSTNQNRGRSPGDFSR